MTEQQALQFVGTGGYDVRMFKKEQIELLPTTLGLHAVVVEVIAAACHEQNRVYCESIGDKSQLMWTDAPDWQKDSAIEGVKHALLDPSPGATHERWLDHKTKEGWVYGAVKDAEAKTHPCMVPFGDLGLEEIKKDELFVSLTQQLGLTGGLIRVINAGSNT